MELNTEQINPSCPISQREAWVSTYTPTTEELLNNAVVSGYHIYDEDYTFFLMEGSAAGISKFNSLMSCLLANGANLEVLESSGDVANSTCTHFGLIHLKASGIAAKMNKTRTYIGYTPNFSIFDMLHKV